MQRSDERGEIYDDTDSRNQSARLSWAWWALLGDSTLALVSAMAYDRIVNAIGPFELTEYLGLALIWGALAVTAPFRAAGQPVRSTG